MTNDIDISLDGFDPDVLNSSNARRSQRQPSRQRPDDPQPRQPKPKRRSAPGPDDESPNDVPDNDQPRATAKTKETSSFVKFFTDDRLKSFLGIFLIILSVFMLFAFISHFKNAGWDQSIVKNVPLEQISQYKNEVRNVGGGFGAWLSQALLCDAFGIGSLVLIPYAWILAFSLLGVKKCHFWSVTFKTLLVGITLSIVAGLLTYNSDSVIRWGGRHGYYINKFLIDNTTVLGAMLVSATLVFAVACVYLNELRLLWNKWQEANKRRRIQQELEAERRRQLDNVTEDDNAKADNSQQTETVDINDSDTQPEYTDNAIDLHNDDTAQHDAQKHESTMDSVLEEDSEGFEIDSADNKPKAETQAHDIPVPENQGQESTAQEQPQTQAQEADTQQEAIDEQPAIIIDEEEGFSISAPEIEQAQKIDTKPSNIPYDHRAELSRYRFPGIELLEEREGGPIVDMEEQQANKERIKKTLLDYRIPISKIEATVGPTVTLYEVVPAEGVRISQIKRLEDDIALNLAALGIRIIAPIPGKGTVGIEVPNREPRTVSMRSVITSKKYQECKMALPMAMGATISNDIFIADLTKMPHLLVAGATGQGKSVGLNAIIASLLYKKHPSELKFVLVDPKMVEFSLYSKLERHFLAKLPDEEDAIITDPQKVIQTLNSLCVEMDNRYKLLRDANVRSLEEYNKKFTERRLNPDNGHKYLPYIVVVVDEFADLIMTAGKEVETPIARIAQKARAVGMHMIIATQRPSTNVITGIIKANFPGRIAFRVSQMVDSKTILDRTGANQLIGKGDMLFSINGSLERVQCAFISTEEVEAITESIDQQVGFEHAYYLPEYFPETEAGPIAGASTDRDPLFDEAARFVVQRQIGSTSSLQRQFSIGYNRAGKLVDQMEAAGILGPLNGSKPRAILVDMMTLEQMLGN